MKARVVVLFILLLCKINLHAQDKQGINFDDMLEMDLNEILNLKIIEGSIISYPIEKAPVVIDVIPRKWIDDFDIGDLYTQISFIPGIEAKETYFGRTTLDFRGIPNIHYTNKSLLMINENPLFEPVNGSYFLEVMPANAIKQIEVIRGRGGTLYGTNAYSGVINITTRRGSDVNHPEVSVGYGSFSTLLLRSSAGYNFNKKSGVFVAAEVVNGDGYKFNVTADEKGQSATFNYPNNQTKLYCNYSHSNMTLETGYLYQEKMMYGITPVIDYKGLNKHHLFYINSKLMHKFDDNKKLSAFVRFNQFKQPIGDIGYFPAPGFAGHDTSTVDIKFGGWNINTEVKFDINFSEAISNVSGIVYEAARSNKYEFLWHDDGTIHPLYAYLETPNSNTLSAYSQFTYTPIRNFQCVAGARVVKNSDLDDIFFSPRLGAIFSMGNYYFKALYGSGFRIPNFFEKYVGTGNVLYGSVDLQPEKMSSYDFVLERHQQNMKLRLNGFVAHTNDGISRIPTNKPDEHGAKAAIYVNAAKEVFYGIEFSLLNEFKSGYYGVNYSWKTGEDRATKSEILHLANHMANAWLSYKLNQKISITPTVQYIGTRSGVSTSNGAYDLDAYVLLNCSASYNLNNHFGFTMTVRNIMNKDYAYPEFIRNIINEVPGGPERNVMATVSYHL
ncbi:TonB-dependent receptor [candidate division KSB1 bacterium]|nr:TonB-dependent receptor [candidate division KSB1 bacterium]